MAKEAAVGKRAKISEAQQYIILSVLGASVFLGAAISLISYFIGQISFNTEIIMEEERTIAKYSDNIKNIGVCKKPSGSVYSNKELEECNPDNLEMSEVQGSLRANILENLATNKALNSVPKEDNNECKNPATNKNYTYKELMDTYKNATDTDGRIAASQRIRSCSALRVIPDALPAYKNEEALLASLNKLFNISNWEPEAISPSGTTVALEQMEGVNAMEVNLAIEADSGTTMTVLDNIERSIREFNFKTAAIEWGGNNTLVLRAQADAFYMDESYIEESMKTITAEGK